MSPYQRIDSGDIVAASPTRHFRLIFDPPSWYDLGDDSIKFMDNFIDRVKRLETPFNIELLAPKILLKYHSINQDQLNSTWLETAPTDWEPLENPSHQEFFRRNYVRKDETSACALYLLSMADYCQSDGIITNNDVLKKYRYVIYDKFRIRIIAPSSLFDSLEVFLHGHSIFCSVKNSMDYLNADIYYQLSHYKCARYFKWFNGSLVARNNPELESNLRSALLNRYPYIMFSRDMVKFYEFQEDYYYRRGVERSYSLTVGYYLNHLMLLLWGMLDHLTVIAKHRFDLSIAEYRCSINNREFWDEMVSHHKGLHNFIHSKQVQEWIALMADMRHHGAHKTIKVPAPMLEAGSEPKISDEAIAKKLREENKAAYLLFPQIMQNMESQNIAIWKIKRMRVLAQRMVYIRRRDGSSYMIDPVLAVDYNVERLNAIIDAFLCALFKTDS